MLTLPEGLALLALNDEKGTLRRQKYNRLNFAFAGALLGELALRERISVEGGRVAVSDPLPTGDVLLDEALALIAGSRKQRDTKTWVRVVRRRVKRLRERVCAGLATQGILRREQHTTLLIFHRARYPAADPTPKAMLRERLRTLISGEASAPEPRDMALISLARRCGLLDALFEKSERKQMRRRAVTLAAGEPWGAAVAKAISADENF